MLALRVEFNFACLGLTRQLRQKEVSRKAVHY